MTQRAIPELLSKLSIYPVLVDIGAAGSPPDVWKDIAKCSIYMGFDPDLRELHELPGSQFHKSLIINEAVTSQEGEEVSFYFTKWPYCSSTLKPDLDSLSNYLFCNLFEVESKRTVKSTTLNTAIDRFSLPCIDWLKLDTQGTDLRIFKSLRPETRGRVLALDIEPGLIDAYIGEDLFVDAHRELMEMGFWLSSLQIGGAARMRRTSLDRLREVDSVVNEEFVEKRVRKSPGWVGARYLRDLDYMVDSDLGRREYTLLWTFALLDDQPGYALDAAFTYQDVFTCDETAKSMMELAIKMLKYPQRRSIISRAKSIIPIRVRRRIRRFKSQVRI